MIKPKKMPYAHTEKDAGSTIADINRLLRSYGIANTQWTTLWDKSEVVLKFAVETSPGKFVAIKVVPPMMMAERKTWDLKGKHDVVNLPSWAQSMRLLFYWLKAKLEAIAYGLREVEEEFLSDIEVIDEHGRKTTIGEIVRPALNDGRLKVPALKGDAE